MTKAPSQPPEAKTPRQVSYAESAATRPRQSWSSSCLRLPLESSLRFSNSGLCLRSQPVMRGVWTFATKSPRKLPSWPWVIGLCWRGNEKAMRLCSHRNEVVCARSRGTRSHRSSTPMTSGSAMTAGIASSGLMLRVIASDWDQESLCQGFTTSLGQRSLASVSLRSSKARSSQLSRPYRKTQPAAQRAAAPPAPNLPAQAAARAPRFVTPPQHSTFCIRHSTWGSRKGLASR